MPSPRKGQSLFSFRVSLGKSPKKTPPRTSPRQSPNRTPQRRLVPRSKIQLLKAINQTKELVRIAIPGNNKQKYYIVMNSLKKFSRLPKNAPKQNLNVAAKNVFNKYKLLPGQSGLGYTKQLEVLGAFADLVSIYSKPHGNALQEGALLSATTGFPLTGRILRSTVRKFVPRKNT
jgi:hypothetical protein